MCNARYVEIRQNNKMLSTRFLCGQTKVVNFRSVWLMDDLDDDGGEDFVGFEFARVF
jgi:hypothetical protein